MITKIQKLSAIHNQNFIDPLTIALFMITKIQKLSAIHNRDENKKIALDVVYDYKDTKIVSNSQRFDYFIYFHSGCL